MLPSWEIVKLKLSLVVGANLLFAPGLPISSAFFLNCKFDWRFSKKSRQKLQRNKNNKNKRGQNHTCHHSAQNDCESHPDDVEEG